jgi:lysophospholipase L1-like esterase
MTYDPTKHQSHWIRTPWGWDDGYREAQAALASNGTPIRVWLHGDSTMAGHYAGNASSEGFRWLIRNHLVAKFGQNADYFGVGLSVDGGDFGAGFTWNGGTPPWTMNVAPYGYLFGTTKKGIPLAFGGMNGDCTWVNPGNGTDIATFTTQSWLGNCQAYDVVVPNMTAGTPMRYSVNGGSTTNITLTADARIQVIQAATGLTAGLHTVLIEGVGATGQPWLSGVTAYATTRSAAGVQVAHMAMNGSILSNYTSDFLDKVCMGRDAATGTVGAGAFPMCPDLVICNFLMSETAMFSPDISAQRLAQYIEALRRSNQNCSVILMAMYRPNGVTTDSAAFDSYALGYWSAIEAYVMVAEQLGCAFVNVHAAWQGRALANGYLTSGEIHPTTAGHQAVANLVTPLL